MPLPKASTDPTTPANIPAVFERIAPHFEPMHRAALATVAPYSDKVLALLLDFLHASGRLLISTEAGTPAKTAATN